VGLEGIADPATYRVAPGDRLAVGVWGAVDLTLELSVSADGALVVPSVGVVEIGGLLLRDAQARVREAGARSYPSSAITLTLLRPGLLRVPVTGQVIAPGTYDVLSGYRLADLIVLAGGLGSGADTRTVRVYRRDGSELACDLLAWLTDGAPEGNPALSTGERVHVGPATATHRVRGVFSEQVPARARPTSTIDRPFESETRVVPARAGDRLDFVLRAAGWLGSGACTDGVWLEDARGGRRWVPLAQVAATELAPGEAVEIPFCREWVSVNGSVVRPGSYPFLPGQQVADYVYLAGGPTEVGRNGGWKFVDPSGRKRPAAPADTVAAGARIWVPNRRAYAISTVLTPLGTAVAVVVSLVALASK
jgi:protein involved in polysaccharide export with SLBB domain